MSGHGTRRKAVNADSVEVHLFESKDNHTGPTTRVRCP